MLKVRFVQASALLTVLTASLALARADVVICQDSRNGTNITADNTGVLDVAEKIENCLRFAVLTNGVWEIPKGVYLINWGLDSPRSMTWRTQGSAGTAVCPYNDNGSTCAVLKAHPTLDTNLTARHPMIQVTSSSFVMDHLIIDGNRASRPASCPDNYKASNLYFTNSATSSQLTRSVTRNALCGSGCVVDADQMTVSENYFFQNGIHSSGLWADGLTITNCSSCTINNNNLTDNTDVQMVMGNGTNTSITANTFQSQSRGVFAAFALDNFNQSNLGNFQGTTVQGNTISCGSLCDLAMNIGPHAWYTGGGNIRGGSVIFNTVTGGKVGVLIEGAGTAAFPTSVFGNSVSGATSCGATATISIPGGCSHTRHACNWVYNDQNNGHTGDSFVNLQGENGALYPGTFGESWHNMFSCP